MLCERIFQLVQVNYSEYLLFPQKKGRTIVIDPEKDKSMVQDLLDFKDKLDNIVHRCFDHNDKYINSLREAFEFFVNQRSNKPAELIGNYHYRDVVLCLIALRCNN